ETSVNFNQNSQLPAAWPQQGPAAAYNTCSEIIPNCNQNVVVTTIPRHHPYRRCETQQPQPLMVQQPPVPPPQQQQQHQIVYPTTPNYICNNGGDYRSQQQPQIIHPQQQPHPSTASHAVVYQTPPTFQRQWPQQANQQPTPMIPFNNNVGMPQQQQHGHVNNNYYAPHVPLPGSARPSLPCQGNQPWTYAYCYGYGPYSNQEPCQYTQVIDIEDFMNNEKRKERSRDAARCRRSRETEIFTELAQVLPLKKEDVQQLDKASVMRIAISYLKVRDMLKMFPKIQALCGDLDISYNQEDSDKKSDGSEENLNTSAEDGSSSSSPMESTRFIKQTLDGFLLILSNDGDITYVTDNISDYLGISKIDMLGQQIWEYAHQCDHAELKEALNIKRNGVADKIKDEHLLEEGISTDHRDLFVRLKCTLTSRGRSINIKSASYKVIHITGHLVVNTKGDRVLVAMGRPIPHPSNIEVPLGSTTFLTKHSLDMKFVYADEKMFNLLGYKPEDLLETSLFNYHHGIDSDSLMVTFKN
ncbi:protein similar-like, partial [Musca vetustissima]|uniref:protein similar-like n=1 Tax=Musca vetustissima TaxID=27455 RepID=UPI002AB7361B